jgi:hypothetical protein
MILGDCLDVVFAPWLLSGAQVMVEDIAGEQLPASSSLSVSSSPLVIASHKRRTTG